MWLCFLLCVLFIDQSEVMTSIRGGGWAVSTTPPARPLPQQAGEGEVARHLLAAMRRHTQTEGLECSTICEQVPASIIDN